MVTRVSFPSRYGQVFWLRPHRRVALFAPSALAKQQVYQAAGSRSSVNNTIQILTEIGTRRQKHRQSYKSSKASQASPSVQHGP